MPITTLSRFLGSEGLGSGHGAARAAVQHGMAVLLQGIVRNATPGAPEEFNAFTEQINHIADEIRPDTQPDQLLIAAGSAVEILEAWQSRAALATRHREGELHNMVILLAQTVAALAVPQESPGQSSEETNGEVFDGLRRELETAVDPESLTAIRQRLAEALGRLCAAVAQHRAVAVSAAPPNADPATGLAIRSVAEDAIRAALLVPGRKYLVTVVMDRLQAINNRFSNDVGDLVLREMSLHLRKYLTSSDRMFRWTGPAITAIMFREESIIQMRANVKRIFDSAVEKEFDIGGRRITIPITAVWSVVGLIPPATNIYSYVDRFVSSTNPQELA